MCAFATVSKEFVYIEYRLTRYEGISDMGQDYDLNKGKYWLIFFYDAKNSIVQLQGEGRHSYTEPYTDTYIHTDVHTFMHMMYVCVHIHEIQTCPLR